MLLTSRIISGILAFVMMFSPFGFSKKTETEQTGGIKEITVSSDGEYKTVEEARDYIRTLDKTKYSGIEVTVKSGIYQITEALSFTEEDSGTASCPITYKGEDGTKIIGGAFLYAKDFKKADGEFSKLFPEEARDKIMMADMKQFGITPEMIAKALEDNHYNQSIPFFSADGERQTIAQFPDDWMHIEGAETFDKNGDIIDIESPQAYSQTVNYGEQYAETVQSWSETLPIYIMGRFFHLWCPDDSKIFNISKTEPTIDIYFNGGHQPYKGSIMYFYNIPEELDKPGEYIYDKNAVIYYYPTDSFETDEFTVPISDGLVKINGANHITFDNIVFSTTLGHGFEINGDNITIKNCEIGNVGRQGVRFTGNDFVLDSSSVHHTTDDAIDMDVGDIRTLTGGNALINNCEIYSFGLSRSYGYAVTASGVNITVSHNDVHDGDFKGIHFANAVNAVAEYNDVWRLLLLCDDVGALSIDGKQNANIVFRYNYVHEIGPEGEAAKIKDYNPDYEYYGADAFYHDGGASYCEMYGNVINGCDDGYRSNGGRMNKFHNNLVCDCRMWYCIFVEVAAIDNKVDNDIDSTVKFDDYVYTDVWKKVNPDLAGLKTNTAGVDKFDPMLWCAPAGLEAYDNYFYYNKADRYFTRWGIRPYNVERHIMEFNPDTIEPAEKNMTTYSAKRTPLVIEDAVAESASVTGITPEIFASIGRLGK